MSDWRIYKGNGADPHDMQLPPPPKWRAFTGNALDAYQPSHKSEDDGYAQRQLERGRMFRADEQDIQLVNAALYLRRPLLISGKPGCGKTSLAYSVARELQLGPVLRWSVTSSTKLSDGLYSYDAIGRLQDVSTGTTLPDIGKYIRLGPLGAALLPSRKPRVLLIDEIDKSDIDLPNDLLHIFEEGEFEIPELVRLSEEKMNVNIYYGKRDTAMVSIEGGRVSCQEFPFVVLTSNDERAFPQAFLRRCLRLQMEPPSADKLKKIVAENLGPDMLSVAEVLIKEFVEKRKEGELATDQLLNAVYIVSRGVDTRDKKAVLDAVLRYLSNI